MIIFLYGEDTYRTREKLQEIVTEYKKVHKSGLNLRYFKESFNDLYDSFKQSSMFSEKKLFIIINPFTDSGFKEKFIDQKEFIDSSDIVVISQEGTIKKNSVLLKYLIKNAKFQEFDFLIGLKLKNWIKSEVEKYNSKIDEGAINQLIQYVGSDLWRMSNEIKKLVCFSKNITESAVSSLVKPNVEVDIFKTIEAIASKNKEKALSCLGDHIEKGESPLYLLSMINFQFRNLLIIKDLVERQIPYYDIAKRSGLHPFVVKKAHYLLNSFSKSELEIIYSKIFKIDREIKNGRIEPLIALDLLVAGI